MAERRCELCDISFTYSMAKHIEGWGHLRRQRFPELEREWEMLQDESVDLSVRVLRLAQINAILKTPKGNSLLFTLANGIWKSKRVDGRDEFRKLGRIDETKPKFEDMLNQLEARFVTYYPELCSTIKQLKEVKTCSQGAKRRC
jgi:hypothetical protein